MTHVNDLADEHARYWTDERAYDRAGAWIYDDDPGDQEPDPLFVSRAATGPDPLDALTPGAYWCNTCDQPERIGDLCAVCDEAAWWRAEQLRSWSA